MSYITHEEYTEITGADMPVSAFNRAEIKARKLIDYHTFGRITAPEDYGDELKYLMCELIEMADDEDVASAVAASAAQSWGNDGVSVSMGDMSKSAEETSRRQLQLMMQYLPMRLFYRGVNPCSDRY